MSERDSEGRRSPELQDEIAANRRAVHQDIQAIGETFSSEQIKDNARGVLADAKQEGAAMIRETKDSAVEALRSARDDALESASDVAHDLGDRAREAAYRTADYAQRAGHVTADYARRAGTATGDFVTANAIPLTLIGLGVGWLALGMRRTREGRQFDDEFGYRGYESAGFEDADLRGGQLVQTRGGRGQALARQPRGGARSLAHSARERSA